jgi:hypothetical protein
MENIKLDNTSSMILVGKCGAGKTVEALAELMDREYSK